MSPVEVYHRFLSESGFTGLKDVQDWDQYPEILKILNQTTPVGNLAAVGVFNPVR